MILKDEEAREQARLVAEENKKKMLANLAEKKK